MIRRAFLRWLGRGSAAVTPGNIQRAPTDIVALNAFGEQYNAYVMALQRGQVDVKRWARVEHAWLELTAR